MTKSKQRFAPTNQHGLGHLGGEFTASYADLVKLFGEPNSDGDQYKVSTEWLVKDYQTGQLFNVYDWRATSLYDDQNPSVEDFRALPSYAWHIGGTTDLATFKDWLQTSIASQRAIPAIVAIRARLEQYQAAHYRTMTEIRACSYATDLCTLAATASRQLAVVQCLEGLLLELGEDVSK